VFGFRTHAPENHLKLMAEAPSREKAEAALSACEAECRALLSQWLFGSGDEGLPEVIGRELKARRQTLAVAESCTGGLLAQLCTAEAGASEWFAGGAVVYQDAQKRRWAGARADSLERFGSVSPEVASELAAGVREQAQASWGLSVTGYAGPTGGSTQDPVGTVYLGLCGPAGDVRTERHAFVGDRARVREFAAFHALDLLRRALGRAPVGDGR
jgi:nicotinamide-nucleotide amidase